VYLASDAGVALAELASHHAPSAPRTLRRVLRMDPLRRAALPDPCRTAIHAGGTVAPMAAIGSLFAQLHAWAALAAAVTAGLLVVIGALDSLGVVAGKRWLDRILITMLACLGVAVLLGPGIVIGVGPPSDPMHYLYAFVAVAAAPWARYTAGRRGATRIGGWVAVGGLITLATLFRLWGTGG